MWSKEMLECSWWGERENKKKGAGHLCGGEKQEKEKRKKEWNVDENEMEGRKII